MHCGRTWAFEEKLERRADHPSAKCAVTARPSPADITLPAIVEWHHAHPALRTTEVRAQPKRQQQLPRPRHAAEFMFAILNVPIEETNRFSFPLLHNCTL
jgi:hypothetical protein